MSISKKEFVRRISSKYNVLTDKEYRRVKREVLLLQHSKSDVSRRMEQLIPKLIATHINRHVIINWQVLEIEKTIEQAYNYNREQIRYVANRPLNREEATKQLMDGVRFEGIHLIAYNYVLLFMTDYLK